jgi:FAD/FMN-containing dehydrogenase/Fe-S oxidoreductase
MAWNKSHTHVPTIKNDLDALIEGEVRDDQVFRYLYSTDASIYQIMPAAVVIPKDIKDISEVVRYAGKNGLSIVSRGGGTSLSGQAIGPGIVLDHSRHLDEIVEINPEERYALVQPGVVLDCLNRALLPFNLMVGPDPASSAAATIGGMLGNNSSGTHSIMYGMMVDHIESIKVVLSDGSVVTLDQKSIDKAGFVAGRKNFEGRIYAGMLRILEEHGGLIKEAFPKVWRNVAGYNLNTIVDEFEKQGHINLAKLIIGSEGTLANIIEAKIRVVKRPKLRTLVVLHFDDLSAGLQLVPEILKSEPSAVELMDKFYIDITRPNLEFGPRLDLFVKGEPKAVLLVEFAGNTQQEINGGLSKLRETLSANSFYGDTTYCRTKESIDNVWAVRKAGLGLIMNQRGDAKPLAFVDDCSVPVENLSLYAYEVSKICERAGTKAAFYAHASAGCLHINPLINTKDPSGVAQLREISQAVAELAISLGGSTTGEHGEGVARSIYNQQLFGNELHQVFREVKNLFDPDNIFNPGKIFDTPAPWDSSVLRLSPDYSTSLEPEKTYLDFSADGGFAGAVEMCNGQGTCRQLDVSVMCPSFKATRDEAYSTRGRANALRAAISGELGSIGLQSEDLFDILDLCLECKACKRECPSAVDMTKLKYEFLAQFQSEKGLPIRSYFFGHIADIYRLAHMFPNFSNWLFRNPAVLWGMDWLFGIDKRRKFPLITDQSFQSWFKGRSSAALRSEKKVVLWDDCYVTHNEPQIGKSAVKVLEALGCEVLLPYGRKCCGRPMISKGMLSQAKELAEHNLKILQPFVAMGIPIVGIEPSCITSFKDEYPDLVSDKESGNLLARNSYFIENYVNQQINEANIGSIFIPDSPARDLFLHGHCYQKALISTTPILDLLRKIPNLSVHEIPSGCCGMAGSFGYEKEHYEISMKIGEEVLFPEIRKAPGEAIIVAPGTSCRSHILDGTGRRAFHTIEVIADYLNACRDD